MRVRRAEHKSVNISAVYVVGWSFGAGLEKNLCFGLGFERGLGGEWCPSIFLAMFTLTHLRLVIRRKGCFTICGAIGRGSGSMVGLFHLSSLFLALGLSQMCHSYFRIWRQPLSLALLARGGASYVPRKVFSLRQRRGRTPIILRKQEFYCNLHGSWL